MSADGNRLAPVAWLFGSPAEESATEQRSPSADEPSGGFARVSNSSMNALARRGMSVHEMRETLRRKEFDDEEIEAELQRLESVGLLDDAALAETLVRTLTERKGLGRTALAAELGRRRIDSTIIAEALAEAGDGEFDRALVLAQSRVRQLRSLEPDVARRRLGGFLARKGYSGGIVQSVVSRVLADRGEASGPVFR